MAKWLDKLEQLAGGGSGGPGRVRTLRWLLLLGCIGAALMIFGSVFDFRRVATIGASESPPPAAAGTDQAVISNRTSGPGTDFTAIEQPLENRLKDVLEQIVGVGTVSVLVTVDSTEEMIWGRT